MWKRERSTDANLLQIIPTYAWEPLGTYMEFYIIWKAVYDTSARTYPQSTYVTAEIRPYHDTTAPPKLHDTFPDHLHTEIGANSVRQTAKTQKVISDQKKILF